jgi:hypothetical protein
MAFSESLYRGMQLGMQAKATRKMMDIREKEEERRQQRREWEKEDRAKKKQFEVVERKVKTAEAMMDAGQERAAIKEVVDTYNERYMNNDEVRVIYRSDLDHVTNPELRRKWDSDFKGKDVAMISKRHGMLPVKNTKDIMKIVTSGLNYDQFSQDYDDTQRRVAEANDKAQPFPWRGQHWVQKFKVGPGGSVVKDGNPVPFTGPTPPTGIAKKGAELGIDVTKLPKRQKGALLGTHEKIKEPKPGEIAKVQTEQDAKNLKTVLTPFAKPGRTLIDPDTLELTNEGKSALDVALDLHQKYKVSPETLTPQEKKKLKYAIDAWKIYGVIAERAAAQYLKTGERGGKKTWKKYR